jgi:1,4-dihydroxy-6-naphthoate synthase
MVGMKIQLGYTPDADDAYMLFGLLSGAVRIKDWQVEGVEANLQTLNDRASRKQIDATMISAAAYPLVRDLYSLLPAGSSFGLGVGPVVVARQEMNPTELSNTAIAIPGATTTACAMLQLFGPGLRTRVLPLDKLLPAVESGLVGAALVIHEEFVTYSRLGLKVVLDLGRWWADTHGGLPMPVTNCVVRKDLPANFQQSLASALVESVRHARSHHSEAMGFALRYSHGAEPSAVDRFVRQYVNELSEDMGPRGREGLETFFREASDAQLLPNALPLEII